MKLAVATTSEQKLGYLVDVLKELNLRLELIPVSVDSGVSEQPLSESETKQGSINRAHNALIKINTAEAAIGIEVGYHTTEDDKYEIFCFASIETPDGKIISRESHRLVLPDFHQSILKSGEYLGDHVKRFIEESPDEYSKQVGEEIRNRKSFIKSAIKSVLEEYIKK